MKTPTMWRSPRHGKIYEVENEAGIGFANMAQTGSLRIEKTSSDGKVEGFSFRVTGRERLRPDLQNR